MMFRVQTIEQPQNLYGAQQEGRGSVPVLPLPGGGAIGSDGQPVTADQFKQRPFVKARDVGRNDPCPCGSGKKYKKCCMSKTGSAAAG